MVVCPKCGNNVQARKMLRLTNQNTITCQVCSSKLRVKNKNVRSVIGGAEGGIGAGLMTVLLLDWDMTGNLVYIGLFVALFAVIFLSSWWLDNKYIKLELDNSVPKRKKDLGVYVLGVVVTIGGLFVYLVSIFLYELSLFTLLIPAAIMIVGIWLISRSLG